MLNSMEMENNTIPSKCLRCLNFSGLYCVVHQHLIEDAANCSEFNDSEFIYDEYSEEDSHICVAHLREILDRCVEEGYINEYGKHKIIEIVKKEI